MSGLPKIIAPKYTLILPSSKKKITYRPFVVKEEKILLTALQAEDQDQMILALKQIVSNCTEGQLDPDTTPLFDIEYLFVNIRAKSVGEILELQIKCQHCEHEMAHNINLAEVKVESPKKDATKIQLTDMVGIVMKYPTLDLIEAVDDINEEDESDVQYNAIAKCIDYIYDSDTAYYTKDQTKEEINDFIESLNKKQMESIREFFENIPKLEEKVNFTCNSCGTDNAFVLSGLTDFFL